MSILNITNSEYIAKRRENMINVINNQYSIDKTSTELILDGDDKSTGYTAQIETYKCIDPDKHYWSYTKLKILNGQELVAEINRNYSSLSYCYAKQDKNEFIITSEDYQCITIINLHTGEVKTYGDIERVSKGWGFCPVKFNWDKNYNELRINGCYWGAPYEDMVITITDLNNPDFNLAEYIEEPVEDYEDDETDED